MRIPFRARNPVPIGLTAFAAIILALVLALNLEKIPFVAGGRTLTADFEQAAGLEPDEEVRIAGVKVGEVTAVDLDGDHVRVTFRVDDGVRLGERTEAAIKIKTVLGAHYLGLAPNGTKPLKEHIPIERTHTPFEVVPAISELGERVGQIDTQQVAKSFDVLSQTFANTPDEVQASLKGLRRLSDTVASRDDELHELTDKARRVSDLLADRNQDFAKLIEDGNKVLASVRARRQVIHQLLVNTFRLSQQVNALIKENEAQLKPMLDDLEKVGGVLLENQRNLGRILELFAPFARQFADVTGTGRWFDAYLQNLIPIPAGIDDSNAGTKTEGGRQNTTGAENGQKQGDSPLPFLP